MNVVIDRTWNSLFAINGEEFGSEGKSAAARSVASTQAPAGPATSDLRAKFENLTGISRKGSILFIQVEIVWRRLYAEGVEHYSPGSRSAAECTLGKVFQSPLTLKGLHNWNLAGGWVGPNGKQVLRRRCGSSACPAGLWLVGGMPAALRWHAHPKRRTCHPSACPCGLWRSEPSRYRYPMRSVSAPKSLPSGPCR